jgi:hypothetical protein
MGSELSNSNLNKNESERRGKTTRARWNNLTSHFHLPMNGGAGQSLSHDQDPHNASQNSSQERLVKAPEDAQLLPQTDIKEEGEVLLDPVNGQIELLDQSQEVMAGPSESATQMAEDGQDWLSEGDHELKRVKVRLAECRPCEGSHLRRTCSSPLSTSSTFVLIGL